MRRQSCSPNVTRGRLMVANNSSNNSSGNGTMVIGSRIVEKMMNARDKDSLDKHQNQANEKTGNDKLMPKTMMDKVFKKQSDMSSKNPDGVKSSTNANSTASKTKLGNQTYQGLQERNFRVRAGNESKFPINKSTETRTRYK
ncbi:uncharacterized protein LOC109840758 [Asparagus officinalis]|nr:uncharacterized protein LOC109840758 [Asparagus officinalis]